MSEQRESDTLFECVWGAVYRVYHSKGHSLSVEPCSTDPEAMTFCESDLCCEMGLEIERLRTQLANLRVNYESASNNVAKLSAGQQSHAKDLEKLDKAKKALREMVLLWDAEHPEDRCACEAKAPDDITNPLPCELCVARKALEELGDE